MTFEERMRFREIRLRRRQHAMPGFDVDVAPLIQWGWSPIPSSLHRRNSIAACAEQPA